LHDALPISLDAFLETDLVLLLDLADLAETLDLDELLLDVPPPPSSPSSAASSGAWSGFMKNLDMHKALPNALPPPSTLVFDPPPPPSSWVAVTLSCVVACKVSFNSSLHEQEIGR